MSIDKHLDLKVEDAVDRLEILTQELLQDVELLRDTIKCNRRDFFGMKMRVSSIATRAMPMVALIGRLTVLDDLRYDVRKKEG